MSVVWRPKSGQRGFGVHPVEFIAVAATVPAGGHATWNRARSVLPGFWGMADTSLWVPPWLRPPSLSWAPEDGVLGDDVYAAEATYVEQIRKDLGVPERKPGARKANPA